MEADGFAVLLDVIKKRSERSDDAIISLLSCIQVLGTNTESRRKTAKSGFVKEILGCMLETKNPQVFVLSYIS